MISLESLRMYGLCLPDVILRDRTMDYRWGGSDDGHDPEEGWQVGSNKSLKYPPHPPILVRFSAAA